MLKLENFSLSLHQKKLPLGAIISFAFGILSWQLAQGIQNIPEDSLQYANDNALLLAKSLRGALLAACYASAVLSVFTTFGLILLGRQLKSSPKEKCACWFCCHNFYLFLRYLYMHESIHVHRKILRQNLLLLSCHSRRPVVEVTDHKAHGVIPEAGSIVVARVTKVMARMSSADIMCLGTKSVRENFTGIIRLQDIRATEIDKVDMHQSFHPGDSQSYCAIPWGARAYFLSTAKNELGVISAQSAAGVPMVAISWTEMQCPITGQIEHRKVAKVGG